MGAPKGHPRYGGRGPGVLNKRTAQVYEILEKNKFNPVEELILLFNRVKDDPDNMATACKCLTEMLQYVYPKRKAIEITGMSGASLGISSQVQSLSNEQLLKLLPAAAEKLRAQLDVEKLAEPPSE